MMEAARTSETLVNFYQTTRRYNPEDSHLHEKIAVIFSVSKIRQRFVKNKLTRQIYKLPCFYQTVHLRKKACNSHANVASSDNKVI
jgi:hypothetical protein